MTANLYTFTPHTFSRTYRLTQDDVFSVVYNTRNQTVTVLEADSAEIWTLLWKKDLDLGCANKYAEERLRAMAEDSGNAAQLVQSFVENLIKTGLIKAKGSNHLHWQSSNPNHQDKNSFSAAERHVEERACKQKILFNMGIELTYKCNLSCIHCYCPQDCGDGNALSKNVLKNLISEFTSLGGMRLFITGGEALVHKDFCAILEHTKKENLVVDLLTNGTMIDQHIAALLAEIGPRSVGISLYATEGKIHDAITRVSGSYRKTYAAILLLREMQIPVVIKCPLMKKNSRQWNNLQKMAMDLGCQLQFDLNITPTAEGNCAPVDFRLSCKDDLCSVLSADFYHDMFSRMKAVPVIGNQYAPLCGAAENGVVAGPTGEIRPCIALSDVIGMYPNETLEAIWKKAQQKAWVPKISEVEKCSKCTIASSCISCPGSWQVETGSLFEPPEYTCFLANMYSEVRSVFYP